MNMRTLVLFFLAGCLIAVAGCTSQGTAPNSLMSEAQADIRTAEEMGADQLAPVALADAKQHLKDARIAMADEKFTKARYDLEKSMADSQFAIAKTNATRSNKAEEQLQESLNTLEQEL
ncbi:DUF4398 domain-containing protein [Teredinibacter turnerae]|nr:DUF4398 domain-containing protein [Teredinibacter turnerae]